MKNNKVEESLIEYITQPQETLHAVVSLLGGLGVLNFKRPISSDFDLLELTRAGLPKKALVHLIKSVAFTFQELAAIMHISERTLQRFDENTLIDAAYSEKAIELARLYVRGEQVFGSLERFKLWMKTPSYVFKNQTPASFLDTSLGFDLISKELGRIEHGLYA
jgi:putative toxin-antitoxin system antitoxin component (TIGR02293 family)